MDDFLVSKKIGHGRSLNIAPLSRKTIDACGAGHLGYEGFFLFEATDLPDRNGIIVLGKAESFEAAMALADMIEA